MFRASNVLTPNLSAWSGAHTLLASDVVLSDNHLRIYVRSTKTMARRIPIVLQVLPSQDITTCPVRSWIRYKNIVKPPSIGPAFIKMDGTPLTPPPVVAAMKAALLEAGAINVSKLSFHSLRRGAAQEAFAGGASRSEIMKQGVWKSDSGLNYYINPVSTVVPKILSDKLASKDPVNFK